MSVSPEAWKLARHLIAAGKFHACQICELTFRAANPGAAHLVKKAVYLSFLHIILLNRR